MKKRQIICTVELTAVVTLPVADPETPCADPDGKMSDGEAAEEAVRAALPQTAETFIFGENHEPAEVFIDSMEVIVEGEEDLGQEENHECCPCCGFELEFKEDAVGRCPQCDPYPEETP